LSYTFFEVAGKGGVKLGKAPKSERPQGGTL
jgi:hypothetical protein